MSNHDSQSPELSTNHIITFSADLKYLAADGNENNTHYEHTVSATSVIIHKLIFFKCKFRHEIHALWFP